MAQSITIHSDNVSQQWLGFYKLIAQGFVWLFFVTFSLSSRGEEEILLRESFAGNISFTVFGNTMRNGCSNLGNSAASLSLPTGSTVKAAYLYWSGSGSADDTVVFDGQSVVASFNKRYTEQVDTQTFYSNRADITNRISGNKSYLVSGLTFDGSSSYCSDGRAYGGWAVVVIYENSLEPLRVVNIFDGFRNFWGQSFDLTPNNFVIANNPASLGGKHAHITWEGDQGNSYPHPTTNETETLLFNNQTLFDGGNPSNNQFNSYSNANITAATRDTDGVDLDIYDIGSYLTAGATSVTTTYSTGQDRVFLTAEIISVPNRPVADLTLKSVSIDNALVNSQAQMRLTLSNNGPNPTLTNSTIQFSLPPGSSLGSHTGTGWSCQSSGASQVSCTYQPVLTSGADSSELRVLLNTTTASVGNHTIAVTASNGQFDNVSGNNMVSAPFEVINLDLSTSSNTVTDLNGGNVEPGDIIRYTFTLNEASGQAVNNMDLLVLFPTLYNESEKHDGLIVYQKLPNGNRRRIQNPPAGFKGYQFRDFDLAAGTSGTAIIDIVLTDNVAPGTVLENTAIIRLKDNDNREHTISSANLVVSSPFTVNEPGNKSLYLYNNPSFSDTNTSNNQSAMSRLPANTQTGVATMAENAEHRWSLTEPLAQDLLLSTTAGGIVVRLELKHTKERDGASGQLRRNHELFIQIKKDDGTVIASAKRGKVFPRNNDVVVYDYHLPYTIATPNQSDLTIPAGQSLQLSIVQSQLDIADNNAPDDTVDIFFKNGNSASELLNISQIMLPVVNVIHVDAIEVFDKPIADTTRQQLTRSNLNQTIYINATISDPFGCFDIEQANISIADANGDEVLASTQMADHSAVSSAPCSGAQKIYKYPYTITPTVAHEGDWAIAVTAFEGKEKTVTHSNTVLFEVRQLYPNVTLTKSSSVINDPINGADNPKAIPGAEILYELRVVNNGEGSPDTNTVVIDEEIPANLPLFVGNLSNAGPVDFIDGTAADDSGLSFTFISLDAANDDIEFSNDNGATFSYTPTASSDGYDSNVTHIRLKPKGIFKAADSTQPQFQFNYKVKVH